VTLNSTTGWSNCSSSWSRSRRPRGSSSGESACLHGAPCRCRFGRCRGCPRPPRATAAEVILTVFLPVLVFESGYRLDSMSCGAALGRSLSWPCPASSSPPHWSPESCHWQQACPTSWASSWARLSRHRPGAVIATIKRLRAPDRLSTLIEAESVSTTALQSSSSRSR